LLPYQESSHHIHASTSNTETYALVEAVNESSILSRGKSNADENAVSRINDHPNGDDGSVTQIHNTTSDENYPQHRATSTHSQPTASATQRLHGHASITNDVKHKKKETPNQAHSPCRFPSRNSYSKQPDRESDQISTCTEITILIHPPNTSEN
jgi:hypothetical protein